MPGKIHEPPNVKKFRMRVEAVERENVTNFADLRLTLEWLKPLASKQDAMLGIKNVLRRDPDLLALTDCLDNNKLIQELARLLHEGSIVYALPPKPDGGVPTPGGSGGGGGGSAANSQQQPSPRATAAAVKAAAAGAGGGGGSSQSAPAAKLQFDPEPQDQPAAPLTTPPPGPGRETAGNTH